jgi:hypothetical protein
LLSLIRCSGIPRLLWNRTTARLSFFRLVTMNPTRAGEANTNTRDLLHRVVFYGDHLEPIERLSRLAGFQVIREA